MNPVRPIEKEESEPGKTIRSNEAKKEHSIFPSSLTAKVTLVVAEVFLLTVAISAYIGLNIQEERLINRTKLESVKTSQVIYNQLQRNMLSGRKEDVQSFLLDLAGSGDFANSDRSAQGVSNNEASIFDTNGKIIFSTRTTLINRTVDFDYNKVFKANEINVQMDRIIPRQSITVFMPIANKEQCQRCHGTAKVYLGGLYYRPSLDWIMKENDNNRTLIFYSVLLTVIISVGVIILLMHYLLRIPLTSLENTMSEVAQGDLTQRVQIESKDEIGRLGLHFNTMVDQLELANKKLAEVHEAELLRAGKLASLGELAAGLVHEMKNPLSGISAATQVLAEQLEDTDPRREIMQEMIVQVERLNKTLTDLLSFAKPRAPQLMPVNVNEMVQNAILLTRSQAEKQKVQIVEKYAEGATDRSPLPLINLDQEQMKQVLLNLILNAFQAMPTGGTLTIATKNMNNRSIDIEIQDTGKGITAENLDKIFTPFFTTRAKGTGLGLPVSKKIVEMHGGTLEVESEINKGTVFTIHLPLQVQSLKSKV